MWPFPFLRKPTHLDLIRQDLDHAVADLHQQRAKVEYSSAMVKMLEVRVKRLQSEAGGLP